MERVNSYDNKESCIKINTLNSIQKDKKSYDENIEMSANTYDFLENFNISKHFTKEYNYSKEFMNKRLSQIQKFIEKME